MGELLQRKSNRLKGYNYSSIGSYFITICVKDKREMLGVVVGDAPPRVPYCEMSEYGKIVEMQIQKTNTVYQNAEVDKYVIMPNHIHMIITVKSGTRGGASPTKAVIPKIIQGIKSITTMYIKHSIWQRSYHDHIIRDNEKYNQIANYIENNPMTWERDCFHPSNVGDAPPRIPHNKMSE